MANTFLPLRNPVLQSDGTIDPIWARYFISLQSAGGGTTWRSGSGVPDNSLGSNGDFYLDTATGNVYQKSSGTYSVVANLKGPAGADGATGATGATGPAGPAPGGTGFVRVTAGVLEDPATVSLDTDGTLAADSDTRVASQKATKTYADTGLALKVDKTTTVNGHALSANVTVTASDVGLGSVTNDAQTKASIVPNTAPAAGEILIGNAGGTAYAPVSVSGDGTLASTGALTVTKGNGTTFGTVIGKNADTDGTLAANSDANVATQKATKTYVDSFAPGGGGSLVLKTNGTSNGSQALLNLANGNNIGITDGGSGTVTIANTAFPWTLTYPPTTGWAWQTQNVGGSTNTSDTTLNRIALTTDGTHDGIAAYTRSKIASTFTITAAIGLACGFDSTTTKYSSGGICVTDGTAFIVYCVLAYNGGNFLDCFKWTNSTTASTNVAGFAGSGGVGNPLNAFNGPYLWLRIKETASNRIYYISCDGILWNQVSSTSNTDAFTTTKYGIFVRGAGSNAAAMCCFSFTETNP